MDVKTPTGLQNAAFFCCWEDVLSVGRTRAQRIIVMKICHK